MSGTLLLYGCCSTWWAPITRFDCLAADLVVYSGSKHTAVVLAAGTGVMSSRVLPQVRLECFRARGAFAF